MKNTDKNKKKKHFTIYINTINYRIVYVDNFTRSPV